MDETDGGELRQQVERAFVARRMELPEQQLDQLSRYLELAERWNPKINLTAIRDRPTAILRHLFEPYLLQDHLAGAGPHLVDAGSGVGVPGIPVAIMDPERDVTLVEAHGKKATFLHEVVEELDLKRVRIIENRLEDALATEELEAPVHVLAARGWTSGWGPLLGMMAPVMAPGGRGLLLTGEDTERSLRRQLARGEQMAPSAGPDWKAAAAAGWWMRRSAPLPHLSRGFLVILELPTN
ncbi:MAG: 16S rRNA (guanine(527)-N(7))-methyltransferase RsmG [Acidobacteria bacterium]|nr:16S rRNA (guanine(527)-N(7))-methyltransferase RsmG [Acidobacteriota bacterium]